MNTEIISTNPVVKSIAAGNAPRAARLAAARGALPISQNDLLEILTFLAHDDSDEEIKNAALETFANQDNENLFAAVNSAEIAPSVLGFVAESKSFENRVYEAVVTNVKTPDDSIIKFAQQVTESSLLELVTVNQQRLIRAPAILDAILSNPNSNADTMRRAKEVREEFFEKSRGAAQIAEELRVQGNLAAAEFLEKAEFAADLAKTESANKFSIEDAILLASHIEVPDSEVDDSWLDFSLIEDIYEESDETRRALAEKIIGEMKIDGDTIAPDRIALIRKIMLMGIKDRVKIAMKGDREARSILIRDPNKIVASAVLANSRITEQEVEKIAAMRTVPSEVLRHIGLNRTWARNYTIIHGLARNPRTPLPTAMTVLTRIQTKDLKGISQNRNVSEAIRKQAVRLLSTRK